MLVDVIVLSDKGSLDAKPLVDVVVTRMKEFDYTTVTDPTQPHDVELKIKCEQRKTWEGTTTMGSDADLPDAPSRIWKGPACQLGYLLNGKKMAWRKEVRTDFDDAQAADFGQQQTLGVPRAGGEEALICGQRVSRHGVSKYRRGAGRVAPRPGGRLCPSG